ncbi:MAG TPA: triple tyrosine motif-containing protein, partial [Candidatus Kapabacteria bacterium]
NAVNMSLVVTSFNVSGRPYRYDLENGDSVRLTYEQNDLSFDFALLDFSGPAKKRYAYMLQGEDERWILCGNRNNGAYNNLEPGHYVLRIKSTNAQGVWDKTGIAITIVIAPPFWRTWWFQLLAVISLVALLFTWLLRARARDRAYQLVLDHALESERMNIAGELHDGPLQDLYATRFLLETPNANPLELGARHELDALLKKVRGELRAVTGELQLPRFENGLPEELTLFLDAFAEQNPAIQILNGIDPTSNALPLKVQQNLFRIFRTALANVRKHSQAGQVTILFKQEGRMVSIEIVDDGRGFEVPSKLNALRGDKHYGLILMKAFALEIGAKLTIASIPGKETKISVTYLAPRMLRASNLFNIPKP